MTAADQGRHFFSLLINCRSVSLCHLFDRLCDAVDNFNIYQFRPDGHLMVCRSVFFFILSVSILRLRAGLEWSRKYHTYTHAQIERIKIAYIAYIRTAILMASSVVYVYQHYWPHLNCHFPSGAHLAQSSYSDTHIEHDSGLMHVFFHIHMETFYI